MGGSFLFFSFIFSPRPDKATKQSKKRQQISKKKTKQYIKAPN